MNILLLRYRWHIRTALSIILVACIIAAIALTAIWKFGTYCDDLAALRDARETVAQLTSIVEGKVSVGEGHSRYAYVLVAVDRGEGQGK